MRGAIALVTITAFSLPEDSALPGLHRLHAGFPGTPLSPGLESTVGKPVSVTESRGHVRD